MQQERFCTYPRFESERLWNSAKLLIVVKSLVATVRASQGGILQGILGEGVPPGSSSPDSISGQKCHPTPVFRPDL